MTTRSRIEALEEQTGQQGCDDLKRCLIQAGPYVLGDDEAESLAKAEAISKHREECPACEYIVICYVTPPPREAA